VLLADDDTFVNPVELAAFTARRRPGFELVTSYVWATPEPSDGVTRWPSGGAGILLSRPAAARIAAALYTPACPFNRLNDLTIGLCCERLGIPLEHSAAFDPEGWAFESRLRGSLEADLMAPVTLHRAESRQMALLYELMRLHYGLVEADER
jgi:hypothetical protein